MDTNYIALAIPFFLLLIGVELWVARYQGKSVYRLNDSFANLACGMIQQVTSIFLKGLLLVGYLSIWKQLCLFEIPADSISAWFLCFIGIDFLYYWFHRASHEINALWAAHLVHHQSEEYNLAVALRQSTFQPIFSSFFYLPLALIGFPPVMFLTLLAFNTLYQFWIHTRTIGTLGPFEWIFNTPSHHRVHHGRNPIYLDRNHGGTLIIWDRLFGTFQKEEETVVYGITKPLRSWNPLWANVHYWVELWQTARRTRAYSDRLRVFLESPGWFPVEVGGPQDPPPVGNENKYDPTISFGLKAYTFFNLALMISFTTLLLFLETRLSGLSQTALAVLIIWSLTNIGGLFEKRSWSFHSELLRICSLPFLLLPGDVLSGSISVLVVIAVSITFFITWLMCYRSELNARTST